MGEREGLTGPGLAGLTGPGLTGLMGLGKAGLTYPIIKTIFLKKI